MVLIEAYRISFMYQNRQYSRLRFGIGTSEKMRPAENYVLKPFKKMLIKSFRETVKNAADALDSIVFNGLDRTMNIYNS